MGLACTLNFEWKQGMSTSGLPLLQQCDAHCSCRCAQTAGERHTLQQGV